jgi:DNA modification methylase
MKPYYGTELGKLYHGDCLEIMPELEPVDLVLTDPPWNVGKDFGECKDTWTEKEYLIFIAKLKTLWSKNVCLILSNRNESFKPWFDNYPKAKIIICEIGASIQTKVNNIRNQYKPILSTCNANRVVRDVWHGFRWYEEGYYFAEKTYGHPSPKSVKLLVECVDLFSSQDDVVLEPFLGSGTTAVACERLNRRWIGIEIEEKYCEIAAKRIENERKQLKMF